MGEWGSLKLIVFNVLVQTIIVPSVAPTPPPDRVEANWLLGVTYLSQPWILSPIFVSFCLSVTSRGSAMSVCALE